MLKVKIYTEYGIVEIDDDQEDKRFYEKNQDLNPEIHQKEIADFKKLFTDLQKGGLVR